MGARLLIIIIVVFVQSERWVGPWGIAACAHLCRVRFSRVSVVDVYRSVWMTWAFLTIPRAKRDTCTQHRHLESPSDNKLRHQPSQSIPARHYRKRLSMDLFYLLPCLHIFCMIWYSSYAYFYTPPFLLVCSSLQKRAVNNLCCSTLEHRILAG